MAANREPGAIDWEIIPDASIHNGSMDIDTPLDEWEDIFEENMGPEGKVVARLQTIISCAFSPSLPSCCSCICDCAIGLSAVAQKAPI